MLRSALILALALAALALAAPPAAQAAPVRLSDRNARVLALTTTNGRALAIVDSLEAAQPFELVSGGGTSIGTFGLRDAEFPDLASSPDGRVVAAWARTIAGGAALEAVAIDPGAAAPFSAPQALAQATGPPQLAARETGPLLAFPDREGNLALVDNPVFEPGDGRAPRRSAAYAITSSGPARRHLPFELVIGPAGPLVLDLVQTRRLTELRVVGSGAPAPAVVTARGVRDIPAGLGADEARVAVAHLSGGRVVLSTPRANGTWRRRRLPGPGGGSDPPAVTLAGGDVLVAYDQRVPRKGRRALKQLFLATVTGNRVESRRLTNSHADDGRPQAAAGLGGEAYVAWTRVALGARTRTPFLTRVD